jgi:hypothetical protein
MPHAATVPHDLTYRSVLRRGPEPGPIELIEGRAPRMALSTSIRTADEKEAARAQQPKPCGNRYNSSNVDTERADDECSMDE